jgi:FkbM family methyltransferase
MGCRVIAVEPQPRLLNGINVTLALNQLRDRVTLHNNIIANERTDMKIVYAQKCWACSHAEPLRAGQTADNLGQNEFVIPSIRVDDLVKSDVWLLKIDVEGVSMLFATVSMFIFFFFFHKGFEVLALESAMSLLSSFTVSNILVEWFPARWQSIHPVERGTAVLEKLYDMGYEILHYNLRMALPKEQLVEEQIPDVGPAWKLRRDQLHLVQDEWLRTKGEANFWMRKR